MRRPDRALALEAASEMEALLVAMEATPHLWAEPWIVDCLLWWVRACELACGAAMACLCLCCARAGARRAVGVQGERVGARRACGCKESVT